MSPDPRDAPPEVAQKESADDSKKANNRASPDWWMVWLTAILAVIAFLQLIVFGLQAHRLRQTIVTVKELGEKQSADMKASIAVAKESADAAKVSADALRATERGVLIEKISPCNLVGAFWGARYPNSPTMGPSIIDLSATLSFRNYGKTPVTILNIHGDIFTSSAPNSRYSAILIDRALSEYTIVPQCQTNDIDITKKQQEISWELSNQLQCRTVHVWLTGIVRFVDIFDETCVREFVWKYDHQTDRFKLH